MLNFETARRPTEDRADFVYFLKGQIDLTLYPNKVPKTAAYQPPKSFPRGNDTESSDCYGYVEDDLENTRGKIKFWIDGVAIFIVGSFGLLGNLMTILVLRRYRKNRNFNILLRWYVNIAKYNLK